MEWFEDTDDVGDWHQEELRLRLREELLAEFEFQESDFAFLGHKINARQENGEFDSPIDSSDLMYGYMDDYTYAEDAGLAP